MMNKISDHKLVEMLAGLEGVPRGPYDTSDYEAELLDGGGGWLDISKGTKTIEHFGRCDPDTIRSLITELRKRRALQSPASQGETK